MAHLLCHDDVPEIDQLSRFVLIAKLFLLFPSLFNLSKVFILSMSNSRPPVTSIFESNSVVVKSRPIRFVVDILPRGAWMGSNPDSPWFFWGHPCYSFIGNAVLLYYGYLFDKAYSHIVTGDENNAHREQFLRYLYSNMV
jgi:hypothetical protein